jgi:transposase
MGTLDSPTKRARIVALKSAGTKNRDIQSEVGGSVSQINRIYSKWKDKKRFYGKTPGRGRKPALSDRDVRRIIHILHTGQAESLREVHAQWFSHVHENTLRNALHKAGFNGFRRREVPLITKKNRGKRLRFANAHIHWSRKDWERVVFADESLYTVFRTRGGGWCWRRPGEALDPHNTTKTVKHGGGKVAVWGMVTPRGLGRLVRIEGNLNAELLLQIMKEDYLGSLDDLEISRSDVIYAHDNDRKHTSKLVQAWFREENLAQEAWPPSSPDINIQEHVWAELERLVRTRKPQPQSEGQLWEALNWAWCEISQEFIDALYESLPRRMEVLKRSKGWNTKY